jgi:hypothetical protein
MGDLQRRFTNIQIAEHLRLLAKHSEKRDEATLLKLATLYEQEIDLVAGSRRVIEESRALLAEIDRRLLR